MKQKPNHSNGYDAYAFGFFLKPMIAGNNVSPHFFVSLKRIFTVIKHSFVGI